MSFSKGVFDFKYCIGEMIRFCVNIVICNRVEREKETMRSSDQVNMRIFGIIDPLVVAWSLVRISFYIIWGSTDLSA